MNIYYIYQHRRIDTGEIFYVGKGKAKRCFETTNRNTHWQNIINKTDYSVELLYENLSEDVANLIEIGLITKYKHDGIKLCNMTIGGEGKSGHKHSIESKKVMSEKKIGRKLTEEHKQKIGQAHKGKTISDKQKKQISETLTGKKLSDAHKMAISDGVKKVKT
jgi:hypothetical protein